MQYPGSKPVGHLGAKDPGPSVNTIAEEEEEKIECLHAILDLGIHLQKGKSLHTYGIPLCNKQSGE